MTTIPVRHRQLHVSILDAPSGGIKDCTVFFIHGAMASLEQWRSQTAALNTKYRVVAYDYFGCGNSPRLADSYESYSTEEHLADLVALFDQTKTRHNILVGHSFGCSQVSRLAKARGSDLIGAVLVAPALFKDGGHPIFCLPEFILNWIQPALSKNFIHLALHPNTREAKTDQHKELMRVVEARSNSNSMHVAKSFYRQAKVAREDTVSAIDGRIPFLVICGSHDMLTPLHMAEQFIEWLQKRTNLTDSGKVELEIVGPAGHQVMEEQPDTVNELLLKFCNKCAKQHIVPSSL
jgi:abhydrolase domain-containing protein 8